MSTAIAGSAANSDKHSLTATVPTTAWALSSQRPIPDPTGRQDGREMVYVAKGLGVAVDYAPTLVIRRFRDLKGANPQLIMQFIVTFWNVNTDGDGNLTYNKQTVRLQYERQLVGYFGTDATTKFGIATVLSVLGDYASDITDLAVVSDTEFGVADPVLGNLS